MSNSPRTRRSSLARKTANPISYERCEPRLLLASFTGTDGDDVVSIDVGLNSAEIIVNGNSTSLTAPDTIDIDGLGGRDAIQITRAAGVDAVFENGRFEVGNFSIAFENFSTLDFVGGFTIAGTAGDDVIEILEFETNNLVINGTGFSLPSFRNNVTVDGGDGQDRLIATVLDSEIFANRTGGLSWVNIEEVDLDTSQVFSGGLSLFGTDGDDILNASTGRDTLFSLAEGPEITLFNSFGSSIGSLLFLTVDPGGGNDSAFLSAGGNDDIFFSGSPTSSQIGSVGTFGSFSTNAVGFENVIANVGQSFGIVSRTTASITGSAGDDTVTFSAADDTIEVSGDSFSLMVEITAREYTATVLGGGGDDVIQLNPTNLTLLDNGFIERRQGLQEVLLFDDFSTVSFAGNGVPSVINRVADAEFELDASGSESTLQFNGITFDLSAVDEFSLVGGNNASLSIIAPPSADVSASTTEFVAPNISANFSSFDNVSVLGHDDDSEITIQGNAATETLNFDGSNTVVSIAASTLSTTNFTNTVVNARGGLEDSATLTGDAAGGNSFVASFDGAVSSGTITTPDRTITVNGFDTLQAVAANENDVASINGDDVPEIAILDQNEFEYAIPARNQSIFGSGFAQVDIDGGIGRNEVQVVHDFTVSLPSNGVELHETNALSDPSYQLFNFVSVSLDEFNPRVRAIGSDVDYLLLNRSANFMPRTILQRLDNPTQIFTFGNFDISGTAEGNDSLVIIPPGTEDGTFSFNQYLSESMTVDWSFIENISVRGQNNGTAIDIVGNSGADTLIYTGQTAFLDLSLGINLRATDFTLINVDPREGDDRAFLIGTDGGDNLFEGGVNTGVLTTPTTTITANSFDLVAAIAGGANDRAIFRGGLNPESLFAGPTAARLVGLNFILNASGFREVIANGGQGDFANLTDSPGSDLFTANPDSATLLFDGGSSITTTDFETVRSVSSAGDDEAILEGSDGDDRLIAEADRFGRLSGLGYTVISVSYPTVIADSLAGNDTAFLSDSAGNDTFVGTKNSSVFSGNGFENTAVNFESVFALTSQGNDSAEFLGTQEAETFFTNPAVATLTGDDFSLFGGGFDSVTATGGGGQDNARLRDSDGDDTFTASGSTAVLTGTGFRSQANGFALVRAISLGGSDQAFFTGTTGADQFVGLRPFSFLERDGVRNQANGFSSVSVTGLAGNDTASLFDTAEDETFFGSGSNARLEGETYQIELDDFEAIDLFGFNGGENLLVLDNVDFVFADFGQWS